MSVNYDDYPPRLRRRLHKYPEKYCVLCGEEFFPNVYRSSNPNGRRLEALSDFENRSYCSRRCSARRLIKIPIDEFEDANSYILNFIQNHPGSTVKEIAEALGLSHSYTKACCRALREQGEAFNGGLRGRLKYYTTPQPKPKKKRAESERIPRSFWERLRKKSPETYERLRGKAA